jgi:Uma2 family endonuclease
MASLPPNHIDKVAEYAEAAISEYWTVDYEQRTVIVNKLTEGKYAEHGRFTPGDQATSALLDGFVIDVPALFAVVDELAE